MNFDIYFKEGDFYKLRRIEIEDRNDLRFFQNLKITIENELDKIRIDIKKIFPEAEDDRYKLIRPKVDDKNTQERLDKILVVRNANMKIRTELLEILQDEEFIICTHCNGKMIKSPVNVRFERIGNKYVIKENGLQGAIKWHYRCQNCIFAEDVGSYNEKKYNIKLRNELIKSGETFVPNEFGFWHYLEGKEHKPKIDNELRPRKRIFEFIKIPNVSQPFVKITELYPDTNEIVQIT